MSMRDSLKKLNDSIMTNVGMRDMLAGEVAVLEKEIKAGNKAMNELKDAEVLFQAASNTVYKAMANKIGDIITEGIQTAFPDDPFKFEVRFVEKRGTIEAEFVLIDQEGEEFDPVEDVGGGLADIIALLLRITYIMLSKYDNVLIADEPLKFVDRDTIESTSQFLRKLCDALKFKILMVTHIPEFASVSNRVYRVEKRDGVSKAILVKES